MDPPPKPVSATSTSLFQVYLRLRPHSSTSAPSSVPPTPSKGLYPTLPQVPERFLAVEPVEQPSEMSDTEDSHNGDPNGAASSTTMPTHITIHPPSRGDARKRAVEKFAFTRVFEEDKGQLELYNGVGVSGIVEGVLKEGRDGLLATLGVTGSGKTHTILGSRSQRGLTQLSLELLFRSLESKTVNPGHSPMLIPSLISADSSEAHIYGAGSFLDGIYGDNLPSRAATPMTVGEDHFHSAISNAPPRELSYVKRDEGLYRQWATFVLDRNFTPIKDRSTYTKLHSRSQDITYASTPSRKHALQRPSVLPTQPDIGGVSVSSSRSMDYAIVVSMYEVYNDRIFDLLSYNRGAKDTRRRPLLFKFTEGSPDRKIVAGLRKIVCGSYEEAIMVLETGLMERRVAGTGSNSVSSRSHGFFCVEVKKRPRGGMAGSWSSSTLTIVDLAGSERARNAKTAGATLAEAGKINESLMYLGQCLQMQSDAADSSKPTIVPFRQCKLTELLFSNSFPSHNSHSQHPQPQRAVMIVTADPYGDFNATSQILRYSALAREVTVPRIPSVTTLVFQGTLPPSSGKNSGRTTPESGPELRELEAEVARLTDEVDVLTLQVAEERVRRREAEASWQHAEEKMKMLEQTVREEVVADMELRAAQDRRRWLDALGEAADASDAHFDRKLDLLERERTGSMVQVYEDITATPGRPVPLTVERNAELEEENRELRARLRRMEQELHGRSPTKGSAVRSTSNGSPTKNFATGSPGRYSPGPSPARGSNTTPLRSSALRHVLSHEAPPKMSLGLGTSRLGLCESTDVFSRASSPLVSCPSSPRSPVSREGSPFARAATPDSCARQSEAEAPQSAGTTVIAHPIEHERSSGWNSLPPLPDDDTSLFTTALDSNAWEDSEGQGEDKENAPSQKTLAATQALAAFALRSYSNSNEEDEQVERELSALEKESRSSLNGPAAKAKAGCTPEVEEEDSVLILDEKPTKRATRSSTRILRSSTASPSKPSTAQVVESSCTSPSKRKPSSKKSASSSKAASPAKSPKKKSAGASTTTTPKKMHALTPHCGLLGQAVREDGLGFRDSASLMSWDDSADGDGSGNWVCYD